MMWRSAWNVSPVVDALYFVVYHDTTSYTIFSGSEMLGTVCDVNIFIPRDFLN